MQATKNSALDFKTPTSLWLGAAAAVVLMLLNVTVTFRNTRQLYEDSTLVAHTHEVIARLTSVQSLATHAETGQRGFLITGEPRYLEPYHAATAAIDSQVAHLQELTSDNPNQQARFPELRERVGIRLAILEQGVQARKEAGFEAARNFIISDRGTTAMDALRETVGSMVRHEQDLLADRSARTQQTYQVALFAGMASGLSATLAILAFLALLRRSLAARAKNAFVIAEQGERFRTTLASIGDGVITTDTEGRVTNLNAVAESLTGWRAAEAAGKPLDLVFRIVSEETRRTVENPVTRALREGTIVGLANHTVLIAKDGAEHPIDDSAAPIRCAEGEIVGCVLVFRDIAERKRAEEALRSSEERLRLALSADKSMGWWDVDVKTGKAVWSDSFFKTLGYAPDPRGQATLDMWISRLHPEDRQSVLAALENAKRRQSLFSLEHRVVTADGGATLWVSPFGHFHYDSTGIASRFVGVLFDVTLRKNAEDELRRLAAELSEADRRKDEFLSILAHELRNPLAPLRNGLQILHLSGDSATAVEQTRTMMERQLGHLVRLVDDLLDVSRVSRGKLELRKERVELASILANAVETSRPAIDAAGHQLQVTLPVKPVYVDADVVRLAQVFSNLLNNAAKYSEPNGRISLIVERQGTEVAIRVIDAGIGIPPEMMPRIFEMFTQVDRSLEKAQGGLGIGLTLVKRLVEMHGGTVAAISAGPGRGSEFIVRLPVVLSVVQDPSKPDGSVEVTNRPASCKILVADDNIDSAHSLEIMLKIMGHDVRTAHDGFQAVELADEFQPDFVLLDIGMPKLNGYEAGRRIRQTAWGKNTVLVASTGWGQDEDKQRSQEAGFDYHIVKPVDPAALEKLLGGSPAKQG